MASGAPVTKFNHFQNDFSYGMFSPKMKARTDIAEYSKSAEEIVNFLGYKQSGLYRRPGAKFLKNLTTANVVPTSLIPLPNNSFLGTRSTDNVALLISTNPITGTFTVTAANSGEFAVGKEYNGDTINLTEVVSYIHIGAYLFLTRNNKVPLVFYTGAGFLGTVFTFRQKLQLATVPIETTTPTIFNPTTSTSKFETLYHAYTDANVEAGYTLTPSAVSGTINIVSSKKLTIGPIIGQLVQIVHGAVTGVARITADDTTPLGTSGTYPAKVLINFGATSASDNWRISLTHKLRYVAHFQQRVIYTYDNYFIGTNTGSPQRLMVSKLLQDLTSDTTGLNYYGAVASTDPFSFQIADREPSDIVWVDGGEVLEIGTELGEHIAYGTQGALSSIDVNINSQTAYGSKAVTPVRLGKSLLTVSNNGFFIREFSRAQSTTTYNTRDLNIFAEDIVFGATFDKIVLQKEPNVLWALMGTKLVTCTYHMDTNVICWAPQELGGDVKAIYISGQYLYVVVDRGFDSLEVINTESKSSVLYPIDSISNKPIFLDSWVFYKSVSPTYTVTGLAHLEGIECAVLIDGTTVRSGIVSSGQIVVDTLGTEFVVGIQNKAEVKTQVPEAGAGFGSAIGSVQRIHEAYALFYRTLGGALGANANIYELGIGASTPATPVSIGVEKKIDISPNKKNHIIIRQDSPFPMSVLGIVYKGVTYD